MKRSKPAFKRTLVIRQRFVFVCWIIASSAIIGRAAQVQLVRGTFFREIAEDQHRKEESIPGTRGSILDRSGIELAVSRERVRVSVAPAEIRNPSMVMQLLSESLGLDEQVVAKHTHSDGRWRTFTGFFQPSVRDDLLNVPGVYLEQVFPRFYPQDDLVSGVLGRVRDDIGRGGIEQFFDSTLVGKEGRSMISRDASGAIPGQKVILDAPGKGGQVQLTLDVDMQQIGQNNLTEAINNTGAKGGDLIIIDPNNGDVLAMVSIQNGSTSNLSTITTPYEPGSTLKPFTVAGLMHHGLASLTDTIETGSGSWEINQRTISDVHPEGGPMTLAHALQVSSNVGVAKAAQAFNRQLQYEMLRDFGFGVSTGIHLPGEAKGMLSRPDEWSNQSAVSLAIGYEISVTPLQMAMAYGALANGGYLYKPRIVSKVYDSQGKVEKTAPIRVIRRVLSPTITKKISEVLVGVVEDGTGTRAGLSTFAVAGKSGTTRAWSNGSYEEGAYFSSFVGFFPAEDPQMVIMVKLDRPEGAFYGGATAAPVIRATMTDILASPKQLLDWTALAEVQVPAEPLSVTKSPIMLASTVSGRVSTLNNNVGKLFDFGSISEDQVRIPDVRGLTSRSAADVIHGLVLRVRWLGSGKISEINPAPGSVVLVGDTVSLVSSRSNGDG